MDATPDLRPTPLEPRAAHPPVAHPVPPRASPAPAPDAIEPAAYAYNRPGLFYGLATLTSWVLWFGAAYLSHRGDQTPTVQALTATLGLAGLAAPAVVAALLIGRRPELWADVRQRLFWRRDTKAIYLACAFLLLLVSILAAQAVSLLFGHGVEQFQLRGGFSFSSGLLPVWTILLLAPLLEELAWHGYGTDALLGRFRLFTASMTFAVFWTFWHVPLAFIDGYYQSEVVASGWLYTANFAVSTVPFVLLMNWLYYRTGRSIAVAVIFHVAAGFVNEAFLTHPDSKVIQTGLLLVVSAFVVARNRDLFFGRPRTRAAGGVVG